MRFLKKSQINFRNVSDDSIAIQITKEVTLDTPNSVLVPKGPTTQRPGESGIITQPKNGHLRYNTDRGQFEVYQANAWRLIRFKESVGIIQQNVGIGNSEELYFGPLRPEPPSIIDSNAEWSVNGNIITPGNTWTGANLIVLVENVFQIFSTNYTVEQNPAGVPTAAFYNGAQTYPTGWYIRFDSPVPYGKPVTIIHGFDR
jgi:hypothetical protein